MSVKFFENNYVFPQVDRESYLGDPIWIGCIVPNIVYSQFQKQLFWVAYKIIELDVIRLDDGDISLTIKFYEHISVCLSVGLVSESPWLTHYWVFVHYR